MGIVNMDIGRSHRYNGEQSKGGHAVDRKYNKTIYACFVGFIVQAIIVNFAPLLFLTFQSTYHISWSSISALITINFCIQLFVDLVSAKFIDKIGYRAAILIAHISSALGLIAMAILPDWMPDPFWGLVTAVAVYAVGGGILEVLISPMVECCPTTNKQRYMSLLHSFYCWGHVAVVVLSTLFFVLVGIEHWRILAILWAIVPIANAVAFCIVPIATPQSAGKSGMTIRQLLKNGLFWLIFAMMLCAGASEQGVSQWASAFAENALGVPKAIGDLAGPLSFAVLMGLSRAIYAKYSHRISLDKMLILCGVLCVCSYLLASLSPNPVFSFIGCALCGFSVGIMWPGTVSIGSAEIKNGGTALFAFLALAGDVGCSAGPALVGMVSDSLGGDLKAGVLAGVIFPLGLVIAIFCRLRYRKKHTA